MADILLSTFPVTFAHLAFVVRRLREMKALVNEPPLRGARRQNERGEKVLLWSLNVRAALGSGIVFVQARPRSE